MNPEGRVGGDTATAALLSVVPSGPSSVATKPVRFSSRARWTSVELFGKGRGRRSSKIALMMTDRSPLTCLRALDRQHNVPKALHGWMPGGVMAWGDYSTVALIQDLLWR